MAGSPAVAAPLPSHPTHSARPMSHEELERIACADAEGVPREQLISHQVAVDGKLCKAKRVQVARDLHGHPWTHVGHIPCRTVDVGQSTLVNALMQQIH